MPWRDRLSVASYVAALLVGIVTLLLGLVGAAGYAFYRDSLMGELEKKADLESNQIATGVALAMWNIDPAQIQRIMASKMEDPEVAGVLIRAEGQDYALGRDAGWRPVPVGPAQLNQGGMVERERDVLFSGETLGRVRLYFTPRILQDKLDFAVIAIVASVLLVDLLLVLGVYAVLWARVLKPLRLIERYAQSVSAGARDTRALGTPVFIGEFGRLRDSIERMVTLLECRYQELQGSNDRFWGMMRGFPQALSLYNPATGEIAFLNRRFIELFGYTREDIPNVEIWFPQAYPDPQYRQQVIDTWSDMIQTAQSESKAIATREYRVTCKSGVEKIVEIGGVPSDNLILVVFVDVTERRQAERDLRSYQEHLEELVEQRTEELVQARDLSEAANRSKSIFLANMSHELRTPLNSVIGFSRMMAKDAHLSAEQKRNLDIISTSGNHLLSLINDILELSKIEAGKMSLAAEALDLPGLLGEVTNMLRGRAEEAGLQLVLEMHDLPAAVLGDAPKLRQVLLNLLSNAIKFTPQGRVRIAARACSEGDPVSIEFSVTDSGIGIAEADQARIFEPFVQTGEHARNQGTGLGLTVSRQYVEMMGGQLGVRSAPGVGSTFSFTVPLRRADSAGVVQHRGQVTGLAPMARPARIVLAEDGPETRLLLSELLTPFGFEVIEAEDGLKAEAAIVAQQPDLVLMDWRMPGLDGVEVTRRIRARNDLPQPRIVMLTAHAFEENRTEALEAGADDFMRKPVDAELLYSLLEKYLGIRFEREGEAAGASSPGRHALDPAAVVRLPPALRERLVAAVRELNPARISEVLDEIEGVDSELAGALREHVAAMQYRHLWQVLGVVG